MPQKFTVSTIEEAYALLPDCNINDIIRLETQQQEDYTKYEVHLDENGNKILYPIGDINDTLNTPEEEDEGVGGKKIRKNRKSRRKNRKNRKSRRKSKKNKRNIKRHTKRNK
jgi:hypothetical protein